MAAASNSLLVPEGGGEEKSTPGGGSEAEVSATHALDRLAKHKAAQKVWRERNKENLRRYMREWKARKEQETGGLYRAQYKHGVGRGDLMGLLAKQGGRCNGCGGSLEEARHLDHVIPRSRGGKSGLENYQYLCPKCNVAKGALTWDEFLEHCRRVLLHNGKWWE